MSNESTPQGTVAAGFESVREEFACLSWARIVMARFSDDSATVAAAEGGDYAAQLVSYVAGEHVVDLWVGPEITGESLTGVFSSTTATAATSPPTTPTATPSEPSPSTKPRNTKEKSPPPPNNHPTIRDRTPKTNP
ncbi:hypothetical protein [Saccharopolyspora pogona]|uniref:hypothetical protein n=1 Tax=Saccharopolyspora pogona TaxID=333966 RepID=UPI001CC22891|nr:hypothetical protein [Saccharopolyspora pogona]